MRKINFVGVILMLFVLFACDKDEKSFSTNIWVSLATVKQINNSTPVLLQLDNGLLVWPVNNSNDFNTSDGQRVLISYNILSDSAQNNPKREIRLNTISNVQIKQVAALTTANKDSIGNDPLGISNIWIGGGYLNVSFYIYGNKTAHLVSLAYNTTIPPSNDGKVHLELHQNAFGDTSTGLNTGVISFDIKSFVQNRISPVEIIIEVKNYAGTVITYPFTYTFN
jgi:hypothetical protein